jgi:DNA-binding XRE family transcriptional regulator
VEASEEYVRTDQDRARDLYAIICNKELGDEPGAVATRVEIIEELERITCSSFWNTEDFHRVVSAFIAKKSGYGEKLKFYRKKKKWTQAMLAIHLGISQSLVAAMENGKKPLSDKARSLILSQDALPYTPTSFCNKIDSDNKQDTDTKNGVRDHEKDGN